MTGSELQRAPRTISGCRATAVTSDIHAARLVLQRMSEPSADCARMVQLRRSGWMGTQVIRLRGGSRRALEGILGQGVQMPRPAFPGRIRQTPATRR